MHGSDMSRAFFDGSRRRRTQGIAPVVTIAVPTLNQGRYLEAALESILSQDLPLETFVADGGSSDNTRSIIDRHQDRLSDCRSRADEGQAS